MCRIASIASRPRSTCSRTDHLGAPSLPESLSLELSLELPLESLLLRCLFRSSRSSRSRRRRFSLLGFFDFFLCLDEQRRFFRRRPSSSPSERRARASLPLIPSTPPARTPLAAPHQHRRPSNLFPRAPPRREARAERSPTPSLARARRYSPIVCLGRTNTPPIRVRSASSSPPPTLHLRVARRLRSILDIVARPRPRRAPSRASARI